MKSIRFLILGLTLTGSFRLAAQTADAIGQVDNSQQRRALERSADAALKPGDTAPESYAGEASDVGPQTVIRYPQGRTWIQASTDVSYYRTDNYFQLKDFRQEADVLLSSIEVALAPTAFDVGGGELLPRIGYRHQWYDFGLLGGTIDGATTKLNEFDFNAGTAFADVNWRRAGWNFGGGVDYTRLVGTGSGDEFYSEWTPRWNASWSHPLCPKSSVTLGYDGDYRFSDPSGTYLLAGRYNLDRTDHALTAMLNFALCPHALLQPYYRFKYTHFTGSPDRDDYLHTLGLAVYCPLGQNAGIRFFTSWENRKVTGTDTADDYAKFDIGGGVNLTFRF